MVGVLMIDSVKKINLQDITESFPAFITMITMVLCYSIADGICLGIIAYVFMKTFYTSVEGFELDTRCVSSSLHFELCEKLTTTLKIGNSL